MKPVSSLDAQLRALARRIVADRTAAEDAVQDTWVSVLSRESGVGTSAWMRGALRNRARMRLRSDARRRRREAACSEETTLDPVARIERHESELRLREAIAELPEPEQTIVRRRWLDGHTSRAIAEELALPPATVRWHLARAMKRLRTRLADERSPAWLALPWIGRMPARSAVVAAVALAVASVAALRCATTPPLDPAPESRALMPSPTRPKPSSLTPALLATVCAAGCLDAPETSTPEPAVESHDRVVVASQPDRTVEDEASAEPVESCEDLCLLSMAPRLRVDCGGVADFDGCAEQCGESFCSAGDLSFTAEDVGSIGTAGCSELWCPTGCDDAAAWGQCVADCGESASRDSGDETCDFAGVQRRLCDLECRAAAAAREAES